MAAVHVHDHLQQHTISEPRQTVDLALILDPTLAAVDANWGDQMARAPDYIRKANSDEKVPALKENGNVVFTKGFTRETWLSKKPYPQGTTGIVTRLHTGLLGEIRRVDVRLEDGNFVRNVPVDFFRP